MTATIPALTRSRSRVARAVTVATLASILLLSMTRPMTTEAQSLLETALIDALARVPATAETLEAPISYVDYLAVAEARPGALVPTSLAEFLALEEADDPAAARWFAASMGIASGPSDLLTELLSARHVVADVGRLRLHRHRPGDRVRDAPGEWHGAPRRIRSRPPIEAAYCCPRLHELRCRGPLAALQRERM